MLFDFLLLFLLSYLCFFQAGEKRTKLKLKAIIIQSKIIKQSITITLTVSVVSIVRIVHGLNSFKSINGGLIKSNSI